MIRSIGSVGKLGVVLLVTIFVATMGCARHHARAGVRGSAVIIVPPPPSVDIGVHIQ